MEPPLWETRILPPYSLTRPNLCCWLFHSLGVHRWVLNRELWLHRRIILNSTRLFYLCLLRCASILDLICGNWICIALSTSIWVSIFNKITPHLPFSLLPLCFPSQFELYDFSPILFNKFTSIIFPELVIPLLSILLKVLKSTGYGTLFSEFTLEIAKTVICNQPYERITHLSLNYLLLIICDHLLNYDFPKIIAIHSMWGFGQIWWLFPLEYF